MNHVIHVVLRELTFHLFAISFSLLVILFFILIRCRFDNFHDEKLSDRIKNRNRWSKDKWSKNYKFRTLNISSLQFDFSFMIFFDLLFVIDQSERYVNILDRLRKQIIIKTRHDVCETTKLYFVKYTRVTSLWDMITIRM